MAFFILQTFVLESGPGAFCHSSKDPWVDSDCPGLFWSQVRLVPGSQLHLGASALRTKISEKSSCP